MADKSKTYPSMPTANWWKLRKAFSNTLPARVTDSYVATILNTQESSARANVVGPLKRLGLINENGAPTELARSWRLDDSYPEACAAMVSSAYPRELQELFKDPNADQRNLVSWFMRDTGLGEAAAKKYAGFYTLLLRADVGESTGTQATKTSESKSANARNNAKPSRSPRTRSSTSMQKPTAPAYNSEPNLGKPEVVDTKNLDNRILGISSLPQVHVNIQLHLAPDMTPDQIDKIFESMAKHLRKLADNSDD